VQFDRGGHSGAKSAAADRDDDGIERLQLLTDLEADSRSSKRRTQPLEWMYERALLLLSICATRSKPS